MIQLVIRQMISWEEKSLISMHGLSTQIIAKDHKKANMRVIKQLERHYLQKLVKLQIKTSKKVSRVT